MQITILQRPYGPVAHTFADGQELLVDGIERTIHYIDSTHFKLVSQYGAVIYHISQLTLEDVVFIALMSECEFCGENYPSGTTCTCDAHLLISKVLI